MRLREIQGGWALVQRGEVIATVRYEVGGLMSQRPAAEARCRDAGALPRRRQGRLDVRADLPPRWCPGFPERLIFATLTCAPWRWVLVAPSPLAPEGFVNVATGETHPVVWWRVRLLLRNRFTKPLFFT